MYTITQEQSGIGFHRNKQLYDPPGKKWTPLPWKILVSYGIDILTPSVK